MDLEETLVGTIAGLDSTYFNPFMPEDLFDECRSSGPVIPLQIASVLSISSQTI